MNETETTAAERQSEPEGCRQVAKVILIALILALGVVGLIAFVFIVWLIYALGSHTGGI